MARPARATRATNCGTVPPSNNNVTPSSKSRKAWTASSVANNGLKKGPTDALKMADCTNRYKSCWIDNDDDVVVVVVSAVSVLFVILSSIDGMTKFRKDSCAFEIDTSNHSPLNKCL